jgi:hypothetical protein
MRLGRKRRPAPVTSWDQQVTPYPEGSYREEFAATLQLLRDAGRENDACNAAAGAQERLASRLSVATTALAAAATISVLPEGVSRWVSAGIASAATLVSGVATARKPAQKAAGERARAIRYIQLRPGIERLLRFIRKAPDSPESSTYIEGELSRLHAIRASILTQAAADLTAESGPPDSQ